jgi:hypothetical protein
MQGSFELMKETVTRVSAFALIHAKSPSARSQSVMSLAHNAYSAHRPMQASVSKIAHTFVETRRQECSVGIAGF